MINTKNLRNAIDGYIQRNGAFYALVTLGILALIVVQFVLLCYVNFFKLKYHLGYDSSTIYLMAIEMYKQKTLFLEHFAYTTALYIETPALFASVFMFVFKDIFISYGFALQVMVVLTIIFMCKTLKKMHVNTLSTLMAVALYLCPYMPLNYYLDNSLNYMDSVLSGCAFYGMLILISFIFMYAYLSLCECKKFSTQKILLLVLASAFMFLSSISSGLRLCVIIVLPILLFECIDIFVNNKITKKNIFELAFIFCTIMLSFLGKSIATNVLHFTAQDSNYCWIDVLHFFDNLSNVFASYFYLVDALPFQSTSMKILSICFVHSFGIIVVFFNIAGAVYTVRTLIKNYHAHKNLCMLLCIAFVNFFIYIFSGHDIYNTRYLILPFIMLQLCTAFFLSSLDSKWLIKKVLICAFMLVIALDSAMSYKNAIYTKIDVNKIETVKNIAKSYDAKLVYIYDAEENYTDHYSYGNNSILANNLRVFDTNTIYRAFGIIDGKPYYKFWGTYTYFSSIDEYNGEILIFMPQSAFDSLDNNLQQLLSFRDQFAELNIYSAPVNCFAKDFE